VTVARGDQLRDVVRRVLNDPVKRLDLRLVAQQLGVSYRSLMHWVGSDPGRRFPAELLVPLCTVIDDYEPLDFLEQRAGRVAFSIPGTEPQDAEDVANVKKLMKEAAEALDSLCRTTEDGIIESREAQATIAELDDVIRQCALIRYWLAQTLSPHKPGRSRP